MSSRLNFRPRPLDLSKQLPIVREKDELDPPAEGGQDVLHTIEARDAEAKNPKRKSEIPIPLVRDVGSYKRDYLPIFQRQNTYIRGRGGVGHRDDSFVEYDMDETDWKWLNKLNQGQERLPPRRFELLIWRLELANAEANDRQSAASGTGFPDRLSPGIVAQLGNMSKQEALHALSRTHALRQNVLSAVYNFWREKRSKKAKPLLRRLQAPTASSDSNPFNVFRPRDKIHRPQTRRRRENNEESLEKMRTLRQNLVKAYEVLEWLTRREQRKCHLSYMETDLQQLQLRLRHEPSHAHPGIEAEYKQQARSKPPKRPLHLEDAPSPAFDVAAPTAGTDPTNLNRFKRRKKGDKKDYTPAINQLPPPPLPPGVDMLFADQPDVSAISQTLTTRGVAVPVFPSSCRPRIGRGGRLIFDRCEPFTYEPLDFGGSLGGAEHDNPDSPTAALQPETALSNGDLPPAQLPAALNGVSIGYS